MNKDCFSLNEGGFLLQKHIVLVTMNSNTFNRGPSLALTQHSIQVEHKIQLFLLQLGN